jgi:sec-independent protein translocase protein TatC
VITQIILFVVVYGLYEVSIQLVKRVETKREKELRAQGLWFDDDEELADEELDDPLEDEELDDELLAEFDEDEADDAEAEDSKDEDGKGAKS